MTCAAHVQAVGQGFPGQLGVFGDQHIEGLTRLAPPSRRTAASPPADAPRRQPLAQDLVGTPVCASDDPETGAAGCPPARSSSWSRTSSAAAVRSEQAGFDGVEIHGAHGYIWPQFLSPSSTARGPLRRLGGEPRRIIHEIIDGVRARCRPDFQLGPCGCPRSGSALKLAEIVETARVILAEGKIDYLDMSCGTSSRSRSRRNTRAAR
jgi:2,4-dienoyl-CoA reductase-like NADH-dependent reductase (Old Yellow Enzyme family)